MSWWSVLKKPYIDWKKTDTYRGSGETTRFGNLKADTKLKGIPSNPLVFIDSPTPLKGEEWDNTYKKFYQGSYGTSAGSIITLTDGTEVSSYGRVKRDGSIVIPEDTDYGFGTFIKGEKQDYKQNRYKSKYGGKTKVYRNAGGIVPYSITVKLMQDLGEEIDPNAELFVYGESIGKFKDWSPEE